jgi:hypothetical protein
MMSPENPAAAKDFCKALALADDCQVRLEGAAGSPVPGPSHVILMIDAHN